MKKLFVLVAIMFSLSACSQNVTKDKNGNYHAIDKNAGKPTGKTYTDKSGKVFPVFMSEKGKVFVKRISPKTSKSYNYYLKTEPTK